MAKYGYGIYGFGTYYGTAAAKWPSSLPQKFLQDGYVEEEPNYVIKTEMDAPVPKLRKRFTEGIRQFGGKMILSVAQKTTLKTFYEFYCSYPFNFPDPDSGSDITVIFLEKPQYDSPFGENQYVTLKLAKKP